MSAIRKITAQHTHADGLLVGATGEKLAFLGAVPVIRPVGATQAAVDATVVAGAVGANPTQAEYALAVAKINALVVLANKNRLDLIALGLIKGAA